MTENAKLSDRARVSIIGRLIPAVSFGLAAVSGVAGAVMILRFFSYLRTAEEATTKTVMTGLTSINETVGIMLAGAVVIGAIWIVLQVMRTSASEDEASLHGVFYFLAALPSLVPPLLVAYLSWIVTTAMTAPAKNDMGRVGATVAELSIAAIPVGAVAVVVLLVFSFVPFTVRLGRRYSPIVFTIFIEIVIIALSAVHFWLVGLARAVPTPSN